MKFKDRLVFKIVVPLLAITLVGLVALYFIISSSTSRTILEDEEKSLTHKFNMMNKVVSDDMNELVEDLKNLGSSPIDIDINSGVRTQRYLQSLVSSLDVDTVSGKYPPKTNSHNGVDSIPETTPLS